MSFDAMRWALAQKVTKSSTKFLLVAMADCVNGADMVCWPSVQYLSDVTEQDRKTVIDNIKRLRESGHIVDTKERRGVTGQVPVYLLNTPKNGTVIAESMGAETVPELPINSTESGTVAQSETVPVFPTNSPGFPYEQSRFSLSTVPKTGHGTSNEPINEPVNEPVKKKAQAQSLFVLPDWIPDETWFAFLETRKKKKATNSDFAFSLILKDLTKFRNDGHDPVEILNRSIKGGWSDVYEPKNTNGRHQVGSNVRAAPGKHTGFHNLNYKEGINEDGTFA